MDVGRRCQAGSHTLAGVFSDTRGGNTLDYVYDLRQCGVSLGKRGLFGDDGAQLGTAWQGEYCG